MTFRSVLLGAAVLALTACAKPGAAPASDPWARAQAIAEGTGATGAWSIF